MGLGGGEWGGGSAAEEAQQRKRNEWRGGAIVCVSCDADAATPSVLVPFATVHIRMNRYAELTRVAHIRHTCHGQSDGDTPDAHGAAVGGAADGGVGDGVADTMLILGGASGDCPAEAGHACG
eukprot:6177020-Pleurochrysis_carterae.AAC.1